MLELLCLCVCPVEDWNVDCGYEEALHSNGGTSTACERGPVWPGDKVSFG